MKTRFRPIIPTLSIATLLLSLSQARAKESYAEMLEQLRAEITAKLPSLNEAARKSIVEAKDPKARVEAVRNISVLDGLLSDSGLDAKLVKCVLLNEATPAALSDFAAKGPEQKKLIDALLADEKLMLQIAVADGAIPVHGSKDKTPPNYGKVMEIYSAIRKTSPKAEKGVLQRLALAVSLEFGGSAEQPADEEDTDAPKTDTSKPIDPIKRYLHFEKAYEAGELDANFDILSVWELRFVVCAPEKDEVLAWGREMLRNFRPDHIYTENNGWRYANLVNSDVQYGSINVGNDRKELAGMQNILMNGGICGRRAFFARYICRAFGIPATARPSTGHGASARWTPEGWVVVLGPGWGQGRTTTRYGTDLNFVATTQARARGMEFLKVKRAYWIGHVMGEPLTLGERENRTAPAFWNAVALATQGRIIEDSKAVTLAALGEQFGEASGPTVAEGVIAAAIKPEDSKITLGTDGTITIPAVAYKPSKDAGEDDEETSNDLIAMKSFGGGMQLFLPNFNRQQPILVRGGTWKHEASLCESATRHWKGRRPKNSFHMRGLRLAITPDGNQSEKELRIELAQGVTMDFVHIPPGKFMMGGDRAQKQGDILADTPKHEVTLTRGFYLGTYEVTQSQYAAVMGKEQGNSAKGPDHPADGVKPSRALLLCDTLSAKIGREVRLPTEAEWEYAARAGTSTRWFFGDDASKLGEYAWFKDNADGKSHPVGQKKPNPWGLFDMYGNISEFVRDEHQEDYYAQGPKVDPAGPSLGTFSNMEFAMDAPAAGEYVLTAKVCTANYDQSLQLAINDASAPVTIKLPFTLGKWGQSEPVKLTLKQGQNTLRFWRDQAPQRGIAVKEFTLKPVGGK
jgi:formylglycine-generating enzyme required for sulfatase activity